MSVSGTKRRTIWMTDDEWNRITERAQQEERTASSWIRRTCEKELQKQSR